jgi:hypothetical protein
MFWKIVVTRTKQMGSGMRAFELAPPHAGPSLLGGAERSTATGDCGRDNLIEFDFSDYGRCERLIEGWWIIPGLLFGIASVAAYLVA